MKIIKTQKVVDLLPVTPFLKPFKVEPFFERVKNFQEAMTRYAYELFAPYHLTTGRELENLLELEPGLLPVPLEVIETDELYTLHAELPGFKEEEIEVKVEPKRIFIGGKREEMIEEKKVKTLYTERAYKHFSRWFELPTEIEPEKVKAMLKDGVLEITLPKAEIAKKVRVATKAA